MDVVIRDRAHQLSAEVRANVDKKVRRLGVYLDLITSADVEFDRDLKKRPEPLHVVEITAHVLAYRAPVLRVKETGSDQLGTFDRAINRLEAEAVQLKERIKAHP